ncbi:hypothetical protein PCI56_21880 [Plesiomonas shigelloides subsp. oncorhynchi]|nr:hypothetical protein [Plesiomonas shigelloides]
MMQGKMAPAWVRSALIPLLQLLLALGVSSLVVLMVGEDPLRAFDVMVDGALNLQNGGLSSTLYYATNFIFTGLAVALAFKAGLFNIGGEGQAYLGGLGITLVCLAFDQSWPMWVMAPVVILMAALFGAVWGAIPGWLQARRGSHTVVTTIMFNFIAASLMGYLVVEHIAKLGGNATDSRYFAPAAVFLSCMNGPPDTGLSCPFPCLIPRYCWPCWRHGRCGG